MIKQFGLSLVIILVLLIPMTVMASQVFLYYDENYGYNPDGWGDWKSAKKIEDAIIAELDKENVEHIVGTAEEFVKYMEDNPTGVAVSPICVPENSYAPGMADDSPIENFLYGGGVLIYSGDTPFYAVGKEGAPGQKAVSGDQGVRDIFNFSAQYITTSGAAVKPTDLGKKYIPDLQPFNPDRPGQLNVLESEKCDPIEVYARSDGTADPIIFAAPDMKGLFVHIHMEMLATKPDDYLAQVGLEIGELIVNRFSDRVLAVQLHGKLATVWGELKIK